MRNDTHETVPTTFVEARGIRYAYRRFGRAGAAPLLCLGYFNSNMDGWDPLVMNALAFDHEVILFDYPGVGASEGTTPPTVSSSQTTLLPSAVRSNCTQFTLWVSPLGGIIAQQLALGHPNLVKRLILLGAGPRGGENMTFTELSAEEQTDPVAFLLSAFFTPSEESQKAGRVYMKRLESRREDRDLPVSREAAIAELAAIKEWGMIPATDRYATLNHPAPTLIVHGNKDIVVTPINAFILAEAPAKCPAPHVSRFESRIAFAVCGKDSSIMRGDS